MAMADNVRVYHSMEEAAGGFGPAALTIGNFDGVHLGHQALLRCVSEIAGANGWKAAAMTFDPHPASVVAPERAPQLLSSPAQRVPWMGRCGIEKVLVLPFDRAVAALTPQQFVEAILVRLEVRAVCVGENFRFGNKQAGDVKVLSELGHKHGFETRIVPGVTWRGRLVSSSEVRRLLRDGEVTLAARLLGRPYDVEGRVTAGQGIGRRQTVPTLNLKPDASVLPKAGVYVTRVADLDTEKVWPAASNLGVRPTFGGSELVLESFLLEGFDGYTPNRIRVEFLRRIRDERKFKDAAALKSQILADADRALAFHRRFRQWVQAA
jgi:riboflavin kinase/FMN adenylyltransferase